MLYPGDLLPKDRLPEALSNLDSLEFMLFQQICIFQSLNGVLTVDYKLNFYLYTVVM